MVYTIHMNPKQQGDIGVAHAIATYTRSGAIVSVPLTDNSKYDLLIDDPIREGLTRVQVKTSGYVQSKHTVIGLRTNGGNRSGMNKTTYLSADEIDEVYCYDLVNDEAYAFPAEILEGRNSVNLGPQYEEYRISWPTIEGYKQK